MRTPRRLAEFEAKLRQRDDLVTELTGKLKELTRERDEALELVDEMREQIEDNHRLVENWKDAFDMRPTERGTLEWRSADTELLVEYNQLVVRHNAVVRRLNRLVAERYPRPMGRPLGASEAQQAEVLNQHKNGASLRRIALATGLGLSTVRTILRGKKKVADLRRREFDRRRAAAYRDRKKARDELPKRIVETEQAGAALIKAAKGLGR
jgi:hypothetical protein